MVKQRDARWQWEERTVSLASAAPKNGSALSHMRGTGSFDSTNARTASGAKPARRSAQSSFCGDSEMSETRAEESRKPFALFSKPFAL